jgi:hypothetical protein
MATQIPETTSDVILPVIVLIFLIIFVGWMLYLLIRSGFKTTSPDDPVASDSRSNTTITCAPGQCGTNIFSGFKTCPPEGESIVINPAQSVCNSRYVCDNPLTPFAVRSDGSTNINGVCEEGVECQCLKVSQCPIYVRSVFTTSNGNPYESLDGQRITFPQQSSYVNTSGNISNDPPIQFNNPATTFCLAPVSWLPLSNPGCNFVSLAGSNSMSYNDVLTCMGMISGCGGFTGSPCLQGTLAFVTDNPDILTQANIDTAQLGCVSGSPCPCGTAAIYDTNFGNIVCRQLP